MLIYCDNAFSASAISMNAMALTPIILGFDAEDISEDAPDDVEGLDASAAHVANLLSTEPADSKFLLQCL